MVSIVRTAGRCSDEPTRSLDRRPDSDASAVSHAVRRCDANAVCPARRCANGISNPCADPDRLPARRGVSEGRHGSEQGECRGVFHVGHVCADAHRRDAPGEGVAAAELAFIRAVQAIPWNGDYKSLARRVLTPDNQRYIFCRSAMVSMTWVDYNLNWNQANTANTQGSAASNELRIALGLPPVPDLGR